MPEIRIRPAAAADIPALVRLDHCYTSYHVWRMEFKHDRELGSVAVGFQQSRLPRVVRMIYPYHYERLLENWQQRPGLLVATAATEDMEGEQVVAYIDISLERSPQSAWVTDLVVARPLRRQGIATALLISALEFGIQHTRRTLILEAQPKNHPAIQLALKLGFDFCGYHDRYYENDEIGIFFAKSLM